MMREYLLYCTYCEEYTLLGRFLEKEGHFEGEYSLLHNRRMNSDDLLGRFLLRHLGHHLKCLPSRTDEYSQVLRTAARFMDSDIDALVEQVLERDERKTDDLRMERELGQLQLNIARKLLIDETETVSKAPTQNAAEGQFMLGKEEGLKRAQAILEDILAKTNLQYKSVQ